MAELFEPRLRFHGPKPNSRPDHIGTVTIELGDRRIDVLFHESGGYRFRIHESDLVIEESFLTGNRPDTFAIIGVRPKAAIAAQLEAQKAWAK